MSSSPPALRFEDYEAIADAVAETERGRWFLNEFARRNRAADTAVVLEALAAIEARFAAVERRQLDGAHQDSPEVALALVKFAGGIAVRLRAELEASPQHDVARALCLELVDTLGDAVERMSGPRRDAAIAPPARATSVEDDDLEQGFDWIESADDEPAFEAAGPETTEEAAGPADEAEPDDVSNVLADDLAAFGAPDDGPTGEDAPHQARQDEIAPPSRRSRPAVWSPGMLDRLSAAERAILFG